VFTQIAARADRRPPKRPIFRVLQIIRRLLTRPEYFRLERELAGLDFHQGEQCALTRHTLEHCRAVDQAHCIVAQKFLVRRKRSRRSQLGSRRELPGNLQAESSRSSRMAHGYTDQARRRPQCSRSRVPHALALPENRPLIAVAAPRSPHNTAHGVTRSDQGASSAMLRSAVLFGTPVSIKWYGAGENRRCTARRQLRTDGSPVTQMYRAKEGEIFSQFSAIRHRVYFVASLAWFKNVRANFNKSAARSV
jgi:hypothetical protein